MNPLDERKKERDKNHKLMSLGMIDSVSVHVINQVKNIHFFTRDGMINFMLLPGYDLRKVLYTLPNTDILDFYNFTN